MRSPACGERFLGSRSQPACGRLLWRGGLILKAVMEHFQRGIVGSFHKVSAKYLKLYIAEFQFRYNNRFNKDIFGTAMAGC
jgi:hypothetical protein